MSHFRFRDEKGRFIPHCKLPKEMVEKSRKLRTGKNHYNWRGGRSINNGYVLVRENGKKILEHRKKAEKALGRKLKSNEIVHHINGKKADNRNCNLLICTKTYHRFLERRMIALYQQKHLGG